MNIFSKIFKQTSWQILGKIITSAITFSILSIISRNFGKEGLGALTLSSTYIGMYMLVADFGFNGHLLRELESKNISDEGIIFGKLLGTRILWAIFLIIISITTLPLLSFSGSEFMLLTIAGCLAILGSAIFVSSNLIFQKNLRYDLSVWATTIGYLFYFVLVISVAFNKLPLFFVPLSSNFGWIIISLAVLFFLKKLHFRIRPIFNLNFSLRLIKDSWPIAATLLLNVIYFRADSFMISYFRNISDVGIYNLAYQFFQAILVLPAFITNAYYPLMLKSFSGFWKIVLSLLGISILVLFLTLIFAEPLINVVGGQGFSGSSDSLKILSLGFPAYFLSSLLMWNLVGKGSYKKLLLIYTIGLVVNICLNFLYIPKYSFYAASWITVLSEYLILFLQGVVLLLK